MIGHSSFYSPYSMGYQPNIPQQNIPQQNIPQQNMQQQQNTQQMQNGGFIVAKSIEEARNYPTAPGVVLTFKIANQPFVCEKAQGFSQFEAPQFDVYRLVKENPDEIVKEEKTTPNFALKDDFEALDKRISALQDEIEELKHKEPAKKAKRKGDDEDDTGA